jgi:hypothetical protein
MIEDWEKPAILYGGQMGGEYLDSIRKTDLATLNETEWQTFLECVCHNYHLKRAELEPCPF